MRFDNRGYIDQIFNESEYRYTAWSLQFAQLQLIYVLYVYTCILSLGGIDKIRNHVVANPIIQGVCVACERQEIVSKQEKKRDDRNKEVIYI